MTDPFGDADPWEPPEAGEPPTVPESDRAAEPDDGHTDGFGDDLGDSWRAPAPPAPATGIEASTPTWEGFAVGRPAELIPRMPIEARVPDAGPIDSAAPGFGLEPLPDFADPDLLGAAEPDGRPWWAL